MKRPTDSTIRNVQAANKRIKALEGLVRTLYRDLNSRVRKLERAQAKK
jgi:hypothetical protein